MVGWYTSREPEMMPLAQELARNQEFTSTYARECFKYGEFQEALEMFLREAVRKQIPVPEHIVAATRAIADELVPAGLLTEPSSAAS